MSNTPNISRPGYIYAPYIPLDFITTYSNKIIKTKKYSKKDGKPILLLKHSIKTVEIINNEFRVVNPLSSNDPKFLIYVTYEIENFRIILDENKYHIVSSMNKLEIKISKKQKQKLLKEIYHII